MAATRGGDLWWDYRWRYFFITVSPGRLALFSSSTHSGRPLYSLRRRSRRAAAGPSRFSPQEAPPASSTLPISPYASVTYTPPRSRSARGGLYLNNIHELRYTRQIYCPGTRGFCEDLRTLSPSLPSRASFLSLLGPPHFAFFVFLVLGITLRSLGLRFCPPYRRT